MSTVFKKVDDNVLRQIETLLVENLRKMNANKIDIDNNQITEILTGNHVCTGNIEELHDEGLRLHHEGQYKDSFMSLLNCRDLIKRNQDIAETITTADMYCEIGLGNERLGKYTEAEMYFEKEMHVREVLRLSPSDASFGRYYNNIAWLRFRQCNYSEALRVLEKALQINEANDENSVDVAQTYHVMGSVNFAQNKYDVAMKYFDDALNIKIAQFRI